MRHQFGLASVIEVVGGRLELGQHVRLRRRLDLYPPYFPDLVDPSDLVRACVFA